MEIINIQLSINTISGEVPEVFNDMLSPAIDFPPKHHPIHDYFGLNHFVLLSPNVPDEKEDIDNETRAKMALSTVTVAVHNTNCQIPFFVQVIFVLFSTYGSVNVFRHLHGMLYISF